MLELQSLPVRDFIQQ